jgi:hypothetical protein
MAYVEMRQLETIFAVRRLLTGLDFTLNKSL